MLHRTIRWRSLETPGYEHCEITESDEGIVVRSVLAGESNGIQYGAQYEIGLDPGWVFRGLRLEKTDGSVLLLNSNGHGRWTDGRARHLPALDGCTDVDLSGSPLTNTLPIRRAGLRQGIPQRLAVAYVPLDTLQVAAEPQVYTRIDDSHFRFQSADGGFEAELTVDESGLVVLYPGLFERI